MSRAARHLFGTLLPVLALVSVSIVTLAQSASVAASQHEYIALGDSIAAGQVTSLPRERGYAALLSSLLQKFDASGPSPAGLKSVNLAVSGETDESFMANGQLASFQNEVSQIQSEGADLQLVTITLGGNDILQLQNQGNADRQAGLDRFRSSYPAAITAVTQALGDLKPTIVVTTYYDLTEGDPQVKNTDAWWVAQFNDVIKSTAQQNGLKVADVESAFQGHVQDYTWYPLDVHANNDGHAEIAKLVWQAAGFDQSPPEVTIVKPDAGQLRRSIPTISAKVTDNVGVTGVELLVNGTQVSSLIYEPELDEYVGIWDSSQSSSDRVTFSVQASDLAGHGTKADVTVSLPSSQGGG